MGTARRAQLGWLGVIALIFFATRAAETNGRSLEEIEQQLKRKRLGKIWGRHDAPAVVTASARKAKRAVGKRVLT